MVTDDGIAELFSLIPSATLVEVGGAAHMIAGDKNDAFSEAVLTFLEVQVRPTLDASRLTGDGRNV
jgi:pimeloyl-ACP methyl ester carboxylesterase